MLNVGIEGGELGRGKKKLRTSYAEIANHVGPYVALHFFLLFCGALAAVEFPEPGELEELLGEEETGDEVWLGGEGGGVVVVDV